MENSAIYHAEKLNSGASIFARPTNDLVSLPRDVDATIASVFLNFDECSVCVCSIWLLEPRLLPLVRFGTDSVRRPMFDQESSEFTPVLTSPQLPSRVPSSRLSTAVGERDVGRGECL